MAKEKLIIHRDISPAQFVLLVDRTKQHIWKLINPKTSTINSFGEAVDYVLALSRTLDCLVESKVIVGTDVTVAREMVRKIWMEFIEYYTWKKSKKRRLAKLARWAHTST